MEKHLSNIGTIMIPDLSGFSDFVRGTDMFVGAYITKELLRTLFKSNKLFFKVSEIEGDAILFYKYGSVPALSQMIKRTEFMYFSFQKKLDQLSSLLGIKIPLSLKFIIHHGAFSIYKIDSFEKLYGTSIIEVHGLLKNHIGSLPPYVLFSNEYLKANPETFNVVAVPETDNCRDCSNLPEIGLIHYLVN